MGHPLPASRGSKGSDSSNGHASNGNGQNGHSAVRATEASLDALRSSVRPVRHDWALVYADDEDWSEQSEAVAMQVDEDGDGAEAEAESSLMALRRRQGLGKRMPVDREEMIRLILQGLQDIGYQ